MHFQNFSGPWANPSFGGSWFAGVGGALLVLVIIWSIVWKGLALWRAAHEESKLWFIIMLIVNTLGILEILYLYVFSKKERK